MVLASERARDKAKQTCGENGKERKKWNVRESERTDVRFVREKIYRYTMRARTAQGRIDSSVSVSLSTPWMMR